MADEIIIKVRADLDGFSADIQEAKNIGNKAIQELEKNEVNLKLGNAAELTATLKAIAREGGLAFSGLEHGVEAVVNDAAKLKQFIDNLTNSLKGIKSGTQEFKMLDDIIKASNVQLNTLNSTVVKTGDSIKTQMRKAQQEVVELSVKFGATSKEAIAAAKAAAELKDTIGDAKSLTDAFNPDAKFSALSGSIQGVASGFQAAQGFIGTFGAESAEVEAALLKVNSAMALSQGLQGLFSSIDSFKQLGAVIKTQVIGAFTTLRGAIAATGLGLLAIAIGTIVANWEELVGWIEETFPAMKKVTAFFSNFRQVAAGSIQAVITGFKVLGDVISKTFKGDFRGAFASAITVGDTMAKAYSEGFEKKDKELKLAAIESEKKQGKEKVKIAKDTNKELLAEQERAAKELQKFNNDNALKDANERQKILDEIEDASYKNQFDKERQKIKDEYFFKIQTNKDLEKELTAIRDAKLAEVDKKEKDANQKSVDATNEANRKKKESDTKYYEESRAAYEKSEADKQKIRDENIKKIQQAAAVGQQAYALLSTALFNADTQKRQEELEALKVEQEEELRLAGDNEQKKDVIRQKFALKEREIKRKQAEADKKKAIMDATIATAVAVVQSLPNFVLAAIAGALGAAQIALIAATPIPKFAKGGAVPSSDIQGMINGRPHAAGGVLIEAEGNEYITRKSQAMKGDNLGLLEAINMSDSERDAYINRHYIKPALEAKESKAAQSYRHSVIEAENNLIARVSSSTLKSIDRRLIETNNSIKGLAKKDYNW
jgi:hypothetical protein